MTKAANRNGQWFRMYTSILDNPKLAKLTEAQCWLWTKMLALAVVYQGIIPLDLTEIAFRLRKPIGKVRDLIQVFISAGLLERTDGGYVPHDWEAMQFHSDVSTERVKRFRQRSKQQDETVSETPSENTETEADTEKDDDGTRARDLLSRVCEILRIKLTDNPERLTWHRQIEEMLRDGIEETEIIQATETARTAGKTNLRYIRAVALNRTNSPKPSAQPPPGKDLVMERLAQRLAAEDAADEAKKTGTFQ